MFTSKCLLLRFIISDCSCVLLVVSGLLSYTEYLFLICVLTSEYSTICNIL